MKSVARILLVAVAIFSITETLQTASAFARGRHRAVRSHFHSHSYRPHFRPTHYVQPVRPAYRPSHFVPRVPRPARVVPPATRPSQMVAPKKSTTVAPKTTTVSTPGTTSTLVRQTTTTTNAPTQAPPTTTTPAVSTAPGAAGDWRLVYPDPFPGTPTDPQVPDNH
jgi:hypothetical protein